MFKNICFTILTAFMLLILWMGPGGGTARAANSN